MLYQTHHLRECARATAWTPATLAKDLQQPKVELTPVR